MDSFTKTFFPQFDTPGLKFVQQNNGMVSMAYAEAIFRVFDQHIVSNRILFFNQPMTLLGKMEASFNTSVSSFDGLSKQYLTPEGTLNVQSVGESLGMQTAVWSAYMGKMWSWYWADNHVPLLLNGLRYVMIRTFIENNHGAGITGTWPQYTDGHINIDRNQWWGNDYPANSTWTANSWPTGNNADWYPEYTRLIEANPTQEYSAIDLRGLEGPEALFIMCMLGTWTRGSRMRLDFSLPKLVDQVYYRSDAAVPGITGWLVEAVDGTAVPEAPNSKVAWRGLMKYITHNRLYGHFSTALYLLCCSMYQMLPVTAEAQAWLSVDWNISLPCFSSVRGRYTFLNEGEAAFVSHRSLNEWAYIGSRLEKINLMAAVMCQATQTGLAIRGVRRGMEDNPEDLYATEADFYNPVNLMSVAASEAARTPCPLSGMSGVYVNTPLDFDYPDNTREIRVVNNRTLGLEGYEIFVRNDVVYIRSQWMTFPGMPTLLLPLNSFPYNNILTLNGVIDDTIGEFGRRGLRVNNRDAWLIASVYGLAGYDLDTSFSGKCSGASRYFAPNDVHISWPVLFYPDEQEGWVVIKGQHAREHHFIHLPTIHSRFFSGQKVEYSTRFLSRGASTLVST